MRILVHKRRGEEDFYLKLVQMSYPSAEIITFADERGKAMVWAGDFLYSAQYDKAEHFFDINVMEDMRIRCRFLRTLEKEKAYRLIDRLANGLDGFFKEQKIDFIMGGLIDCYVQDVLNRVATLYGILYVSFVGHFFNGYARVSVRGELNQFPREVSQQEIQSVLADILRIEYKPRFDANQKKKSYDVIKIYIREMIKRKYFGIKKVVSGDPDNYHYGTVLEKNWKFKKVMDKDSEKYFQHTEEIKDKIKKSDKTVLMPLHLAPEATVDYWCDKADFALYENSVLNIVRQASREVQLVIKEHPAMYMQRNLEFYRQLKKYSNVYLIHPYDNSNELLECIDNVAVYTGSVGVEALFRGKRVFTFTDNYYSNIHPNVHKIEKIDLSIFDYPVVEYSNERFMSDLLQGMFQARFYNNNNMFNSDMQKMSDALKLYVTERIAGNNGKD